MKLFTTHKPNLESCPDGLKKNILSWEELNNEMEFEYCNDEEMNSWMKLHTLPTSYECFEQLATGAGRADFYRIRKLFVEGGIWFDADLPSMSIIKKVPNIEVLLELHKTVFFVTKKTNEPRFMIMASKSNNPIFEEFEKEMCVNIEKHKQSKEFIETIDLTGPKAFHKIICKYLKYEKISELKIGDHFSFGDISFVFCEDVLDHSTKTGGAIIRYPDYLKDLKNIEVQHHKKVNALK